MWWEELITSVVGGANNYLITTCVVGGANNYVELITTSVVGGATQRTTWVVGGAPRS